MRHSALIGVLVSIGLCLGRGVVWAAERTSDDNAEALEKILNKYPDADLDKDGKLTPQEARAYAKELKSGGGSTTKPSTMPAPRARKPAQPTITPTFADVAYGPHPNNKFDLWLAKSDRPAPLIVYIHGGGFVGGDKSGVSPVALKQCLGAGVSIASINYRFRTEASINVVLRDSARAIQFLRSKAGEYNLDKARVAAFGGSAGAGTSLWLAFHDDLADPTNADPVLTESTRLTAAAANGTQATYDITKWRTILGSDDAMQFYPEVTWPAFYGLKTMDDLQSDEGKRLRADVDMLALISKDDPPIYLASSERGELTNKGATNHTPRHAEAVAKQCKAIGVPVELVIAPKTTGTTDSAVTFLLERIGLDRPHP